MLVKVKCFINVYQIFKRTRRSQKKLTAFSKSFDFPKHRANHWNTQGATHGILRKLIKVNISIKHYQIIKKTRCSPWIVTKITKSVDAYWNWSNPWKHKAQPMEFDQRWSKSSVASEFISPLTRQGAAHEILPQLVNVWIFINIDQILENTRRSPWNVTNVCQSQHFH